MSRFDAYKMIQRLAEDAGISSEIACYTFRATGITEYLRNGGTIEHAQLIAAHTSHPEQLSSMTGRAMPSALMK